MNEQEFKNLPIMMTVKDIKDVLKIGTNSAYDLIHQKKFPILKLSERKFRIPKDEFVKWVKETTKYYDFEEGVIK
ncbi:helix-turn-helix domain-containing protein [Clostridium tyrobutyricum]|uniref:helix-turn-helix domain-containing protein n=1 Tax=Clostridium tyrobutyricum TaxID=1519 RepID=UPI001C3835E4|nr:helix-turn-helix domain-containing protein [Clostridium tyrobutyricum]MBV4445338.1 helix-turn-helix domain-containing protein [Clostridium tyrobutyricum]MBV4445457.1 helix-turn-helix domain-containing protein [Clostridium tyrobutyricum]